MNTESELAGKVAVVTGGSRGIGLGISRELAVAGALVAVVAMNAERAGAAAAELHGEGHAAYSCDVSDNAACRGTVASIEEAQGPVAILVNNAGIARDGVLLRMSGDDWSSVIETNLRGAFNMIQAVARGMMRKRSGSIVNVSSVVGLMGNAGQANYAASKAGLHGLTKSVAKELARRKVRCNAVAPGYIETDMTAGLNESAVGKLSARIPAGRLGKPSDVAGLVRFLAGSGASYITGQIIAVDGGMAM